MDKHLKTATALTDFLENKFSLFGYRFGVDALLGFVPWLGDFITMILSGYLIWIGMQMKLPQDKVNKMITNVIMDFMVGSIPLLGDIGDVVFRANSRNLDILRSYIAAQKAEEGTIIRDTT